MQRTNERIESRPSQGFIFDWQEAWREGLLEGWREGRLEAHREFLVRLLRRRLGKDAGTIIDRVVSLTQVQMDAFTDAIFDLQTPVDAQRLLAELD